MYAQDNNSLPVWIILSPAHHHISINSQPFLVGIVSGRTGGAAAMAGCAGGAGGACCPWSMFPGWCCACGARRVH